MKNRTEKNRRSQENINKRSDGESVAGSMGTNVSDYDNLITISLPVYVEGSSSHR